VFSIPAEVSTSCTPSALLNEFVDQDVVYDLEEADKVLNWHDSLVKLIPIKTTADHNCLCHGVSLSLWGVQDESYHLRKAIEQSMLGDAASLFKNCWRDMLVQRDMESFGFEIEREEEEWEREWEQELELVKDTNCSLTEIHVYVLANVIRRPIIVYSRKHVRDLFGNDMAPCYFGGVYLPFLWEPTECFQSPVMLAYNDAHFTALIPLESPKDSAMPVPLVNRFDEGLKVQFVTDKVYQPGTSQWSLMLKKWMEMDCSYPLPGLSALVVIQRSADFTQEIRQLVRQQQDRDSTPAPPCTPTWSMADASDVVYQSPPVPNSTSPIVTTTR